MQNEWKTIWGKRTADEKILKTEDKKQIFLELKRCNGFDVVEDGLTYELFEEQKNDMENWISGKAKQKMNSFIEKNFSRNLQRNIRWIFVLQIHI